MATGVIINVGGNPQKCQDPLLAQCSRPLEMHGFSQGCDSSASMANVLGKIKYQDKKGNEE